MRPVEGHLEEPPPTHTLLRTGRSVGRVRNLFPPHRALIDLQILPRPISKLYKFLLNTAAADQGRRHWTGARDLPRGERGRVAGAGRGILDCRL